MKLDPGIHIAMHSVLSLNPGVTARGTVGRLPWSADLPLAPLGSLLLEVLRGIAGEVVDTKKISS